MRGFPHKSKRFIVNQMFVPLWNESDATWMSQNSRIRTCSEQEITGHWELLSRSRHCCVLWYMIDKSIIIHHKVGSGHQVHWLFITNVEVERMRALVSYDHIKRCKIEASWEMWNGVLIETVSETLTATMMWGWIIPKCITQWKTTMNEWEE